MNKVNMEINQFVPGNGRAARFLASLYLIFLVVGIYSILRSVNYDFLDHNHFVFQNIGRASVIAQAVLVLAVSYLQKDAYRAIRLRKDKLDERQLQVRRRIFERSYAIATAVSVIASYIIYKNINNFVWANALNHNWWISNDIVLWVPISMVILFFGLPALLASWEKDS